MSDTFNDEALTHSEALYRFARRLCRLPADAEDLLQETFLKAYRSFHQYTPGTNCKSWLFRIMHNCHRQKWRKAETRATHVAIEQEGGEFVLHNYMLEKDETYKDNPEKRLLDRLPSAAMQKALEELPEEYRTTLLLCDVEQMSYQEVADLLEIPIGTVRSRLNRARGRLQRRLMQLQSLD